MARTDRRLSAIGAARLTKPGMYADGNGLYLRVGPTGAKSWVFRFRYGTKRHDMGLGTMPPITLAEARGKGDAARRLLIDGKNPLHERRQERASTILFRDAASQYIAAHAAGWKNEKHRWQWGHTLETLAFPVIGDLAVSAVNQEHVLKILEPIWLEKNETASRLRGRIESVLDWARVKGFRTGDNPARWKGHLDQLLPRPSKVQEKRHYPALPYAQAPEFMRALREQGGVAAVALRFQILNANRSGEVLGARWQELDLDAGQWTIPASRMKAKSQHVIPLSEAALAILKALTPTSEFVFPNAKGGKLSDTAMVMLVRRMHAHDVAAGRPGFLDPKRGELIVPHGFRSTFKDWAAEATTFPNEVTEMALAHTVGSAVEAAYRRGNLLEKRRELMTAWADYLLA